MESLTNKISLLNRLIEDNPQGIILKDPTLEALRESIRINLENLFNTKRRFLSWKTNYKQLEKSVINYGIDDFLSLWIDSLDSCEDLCRQIEQAIRLFEPRLSEVAVYVKEAPNYLNRTLQLRVEGILKEGFDLEPVSYHSTISSLTHWIDLKAAYSEEKINV